MNKLFINYEVINSPAKVFYSIMLTLMISLSYFTLSYYIFPAVIAGTVSTAMYMFYNAVIAGLWVGIIKVVNKFWLQDKLINSGAYDVNG